MASKNKNGPNKMPNNTLDSNKENGESGNKKTRQKNILDTVVLISSIGWTIIACVAIGVFVGFWVDKFLKTQPIFTILFSILGILSALYFLFKLSKGSNK